MILAESSIGTAHEDSVQKNQYYNLKSEDSLMEHTIDSEVDN